MVQWGSTEVGVLSGEGGWLTFTLFGHYLTLENLVTNLAVFLIVVVLILVVLRRVPPVE